MKKRAYVFTNNNANGDIDYKAIDCKYIIVGEEHAPTTGHLHHQGYIMFNDKKAFNVVKRLLPEGCHIEGANGSPQKNIEYCSKEKVLCEYGQRPKMGKRNDIIKVREILKTTGMMRDVVREVDSYQACRHAELILKYDERKRDFKPVVKWFYGATGTGKTKTAFDESKDPWVSGKNLKWWDGYDAHKNIIVDDFRGDFCTFHELLRILDRYEYRIENKGGSRQLLAEQIIITCPFSPTEVYHVREDIDQLLRRIDEIREFK